MNINTTRGLLALVIGSVSMTGCSDTDGEPDPATAGQHASDTGPGAFSTTAGATTDPEGTTRGGTESDDTAGDTSGELPPPVPLHTVIYTAGPAWDPKLPPRQQDLADHFVYVGGLFDAGVLLANGPFGDDGRGLYLHIAEQVDDIDALVAEDPAVISGVLQLDELAGWTLLLSQMDLDVGDDAFFVLNYSPGDNWSDGVPLGEQPGLDEHLQYVGGAFAAGDLLAGGPVNDMAGRYIVALPDIDAATTWVAADPTVEDGLFAVETKPWIPLQRQSVADALGE